MAEHGLLLVAIRTDQVDIARRMRVILEASRPNHDPPETVPHVFFRLESEVAANDLDHLAHFFGDGADCIGVGSRTTLEASGGE